MAEVKSGYMQKCGKSVRNWKRRWFVLKPNGYLYYYESSNLKSEKGKIDIIDAMKVAPWQEVGSAERKLPSGYSYENAFAIVSSDRTYTCVCENEGDSTSWINAIEKVRGAAGSGEQQYPPPTYNHSEEQAQVKQDDQLMSSPPPYTTSPPSPSQADSLPRKQPPSGPVSQPPIVPMPQPQTYGGTMPIGHTPSKQPLPPSPAYQPQPNVLAGAPLPGGNPSAGPGYQGAYPVGNYQAQRNPVPPRPMPQPMPQPSYPPQQQYRQPPPPRPQYYQQPPRPAYQSYPQRPPPPQQYYRPPPPQQYCRPPPAPQVRQQSTTTVTVVNLAAPQQKYVVYR